MLTGFLIMIISREMNPPAKIYTAALFDIMINKSLSLED